VASLRAVQLPFSHTHTEPSADIPEYVLGWQSNRFTSQVGLCTTSVIIMICLCFPTGFLQLPLGGPSGFSSGYCGDLLRGFVGLLVGPYGVLAFVLRRLLGVA
jgi:hypothetical protein